MLGSSTGDAGMHRGSKGSEGDAGMLVTALGC